MSNDPRFHRILERLDVGDCWVWTGALQGSGYGVIGNSGNGSRLVHRIVYEALVGPIPEGLEMDHLCRNPPCVNPDHLEPVTRAENQRRGRFPAIGARTSRRNSKAKTHCARGHPYTNVYVDRHGWRSCKTCRDEAQKRHAARKK